MNIIDKTTKGLLIITLGGAFHACGLIPDKSSNLDEPCNGMSLTDPNLIWSTGERDPAKGAKGSGEVGGGDGKAATELSDSTPCKGNIIKAPKGDIAESTSADSASSAEPDMLSDASAGKAADSGAPATEGAWESGKEGGGTAQSQGGILTAGTFDDSVNATTFQDYWQSPLNPTYGGKDQYQFKAFEEIAIAERFTGAAKARLQLAFIVDATGSMGDELRYIQTEIDAISVAVKEKYPNVGQEFSLIVYRDEGDQYLTRGIGFTDDLAVFRDFLTAQSAGGGGDYPEAMAQALEEAKTKLQWAEDAAKVMFLIADAPPHDDRLDATFAGIDQLKSLDVHIYPVAASGVADLAERVMRYAAATTGGEYIFITDDSGVGNAHAEPHVPCYKVRKLNQVMIDALSQEIEQIRLPINPEHVIREVGSSTDGVCQGGQTQ